MKSPRFAHLFEPLPDAWILHRDEDLLVIDKPPFVSTHAPDAGRRDDAWSRATDGLVKLGEASYLGIHQRLDRDTSGVLLFTRRKEANPAIAAQFEGRQVEKSYAAVVEAGLREGQVLRHRLVKDREGRMRAMPATARDGLEAVTRVASVERRGRRSLVELRPETGRTHQIRVQLAAAGAPIVGDTLYDGPPAPRLMLHAKSLALVHPSTKARVVFRAPVPASFELGLEGAAPRLPRDARTLEARLREAIDRRYGLALQEGTDAFRLANGAGDALPGVDVDLYGEHLVVSLSSDEAMAARDAILDAAATLGARGVYLKMRPKHASVIVDARREDFAPKEPVRGEPAPAGLVIHEHGVPFGVALGDGLSTGIFLDQRENRRRVAELSSGARILNLFAYTGAFTVAAVAAGASSSVTIDVSPAIAAAARANLARVGADPERHQVIEADAAAWLERVAPKGDPFDLVVLDPPSFATTKQSRFRADGDYRRLAALAMKVVAPGGRLLACTNHRGIVHAKLRRFLHEAARDSGRDVVQMKDLPAPEDFPAEPGREPHLKSILVTLATLATVAAATTAGPAPKRSR